MNLWGVAPLITAALLGAGTHRAPVADPSPPVVAATAPVLNQVSSDTWQTTVLLTGITGGCPAVAAGYVLDTTSPNGSLPATGPVTPQPVPASAGAKASACQVTLTFKPLTGVPASAALMVGGSAAQPLTVSRQVTLFAYLGWPGIFGAGLALLLLLFCLGSVRVFDRAGVRQRPGAGGFWRHEIFASGAWTLNDSWATNITVALAVVTPIVAAVPATELLFRGVPLDRFAALVTLAAGFAAAAPLILAIRYARWLRRNPGVTDDATLHLPAPAWPGEPVRLAGQVTLAAGTLLTVSSTALPAIAVPGQPGHQGHAAAQPAQPAQLPRPAEQRVQLPAARQVTLGGQILATPVCWDDSRGWLLLPPAISEVALEQGEWVLLGDGSRAALASRIRHAGLPLGAVAEVSADIWRARVTGDGDGAAAPGPGVDVCAADGATISVPWGATAWHPAEPGGQSAASITAGSKLSIPSGCLITIFGGTMALPGGADMIVKDRCVIRVCNRAGSRAGPLIIGAGQVVAAKDHPADDVGMDFPVWIAAASGATVSAIGIAQLTMPEGTLVSAPNRDREPRPLAEHRLRSRLPQSANSLAGTVGMVIAAGLVTMFGIGAQIGLAIVLANLSELSTGGRWTAGVALAIAAAFMLRYAVTSIGTLADPEPGSSMSGTAGTSFTL